MDTKHKGYAICSYKDYRFFEEVGLYADVDGVKIKLDVIPDMYCGEGEIHVVVDDEYYASFKVKRDEASN